MDGVSIIEHTADVGIEATAETLEEAFSRALSGMTDIIVGIESVEERESRAVRVQGGDRGALLVAFLSEALYLLDGEGFVSRSATVAFHGEGLVATLKGERLDNSRHKIKTEVKAVTYHMLLVQESPPLVRVLFDI